MRANTIRTAGTVGAVIALAMFFMLASAGISAAASASEQTARLEKYLLDAGVELPQSLTRWSQQGVTLRWDRDDLVIHRWEVPGVPRPTAEQLQAVTNHEVVWVPKSQRVLDPVSGWRVRTGDERYAAWTNSPKYKKAARLRTACTKLTNLLVTVSFPGVTNSGYSVGDVIDFAESGTLTASQETRVNRLVNQYITFGGSEDLVSAPSPTNIPPNF